MSRNSITPRWHSFTKGDSVLNAHSFGDILRAGDLRTGHPVDRWFVVRTKLRFAVRSESWKSHLDQAHPAIARRAQLLVITIAWHVTASLFARFDHARALWKLMPHAINLDVKKLWSMELDRPLSFHKGV